MYSRHVHLTGIAAAVSAAAATLLVGATTANATESDDQFLSVVAELGLGFATPDEAIEAGNNICDIVAEGTANNIAPPEIRSSIIESLRGEGLDGPRATQLMWGAVNAYCPQYDAAVGD